MAKRKKLDVLTGHRLKKVVCELREILEDANLKKTDIWDLQQATDMIEEILECDRKRKEESGKRADD